MGQVKAEEAKGASLKDLYERLSSSEKGISAREAKTRLDQYGYNEIEEKKENPLLKFLGYFWGPIPWMIEAAAILSIIINQMEDFAIITALLLINAVVGFWQEHKADDAIESLKQRLALKAVVLRDGDWQEIDARELVPGDIVRVRLGDIVPADLKLTSGDYLQADESALTGESLPVEKHVFEVAYSGSVVQRGEMEGLVVATGMNSFFGLTAKLVEEAETHSHFEKALIKIGDYLIILAVAMVAIICLVALFRNEGLKETLQYALVLTVAAIPAALPAVLSVTLAVGATTIAKKEAIVSRLVAIEEMAGVDVLCSDKTGTITKNELTVAEVEPQEGFSSVDVLLCGTLASKEESKDPMDNAIIEKAKDTGSLGEGFSDYNVVEFQPFDPVTKRTEATVEEKEGGSFKVSKGAPQVILAMAEVNDETKNSVTERVNSFATKGFRALGVARTNGNGKWQLVGLVPLFDPPRDDSAETIKTAQEMGVNVKMVTGDHAAIASEIAGQVNLGTDIVPASALTDKPDKEVMDLVEEADGFAQVYPEHKFRIVELLEEKDHITGMTGDGVNDAPALKKADVGIAVQGATDAAKSAADIVLTLSGLSVIIDALKESRRIFQRMTSYAIYRIAETPRVLFFITLSILVFSFYPVSAIMIVLLALLNDVPIMAIAYDRAKFSNRPERWDMREVLGMATVLGFVGVIASFGIFYLGQEVFHLSRGELQSFIFLKLAVAGHLTIFLARTRGPFWSDRPSGALFWSAVVTKLLATLIVVYGWLVTPIGWKLALFVWVYALVAFVITDFIKVWTYKVMDHTGLRFSRLKRTPSGA